MRAYDAIQTVNSYYTPMPRTSLTVELALLGFLRHEPMHGYELYQHLSGASELWMVWRVKQSQMYALLNKLEKAGYIRATLQPQASSPPRKVFHLTEAGHKVFLDWISSPVLRARHMRMEFLAKLYFAQREGDERACHLIDQQLAICESWFENQRAQAEQRDDAQSFAWVVGQFRIHQIESLLDWLEQCRGKFTPMQSNS